MEDNRILHLSSEKGKFIVNKCLERKLFINTLKLEKLLILTHGEMLSKYGQEFFKEKVIAVEHGLILRDVERDFLMYENEFNKQLKPYIHLVGHEEEVVNEIVEEYGSFGTLKLNNLKELQMLKNVYYNNKATVIPNEAIKEVFDAKNNGIEDFKLVKKLKK